MDRAERMARIALWMVPGIGPRAFARALESCGSAAAAVVLERDELARRIGLGEGAAAAWAAAPHDPAAAVARLEAALASRDGRFVVDGEEGFPLLGDLPDPPPVVSVRGALAGAGGGRHAAAVAVIGSRRADLLALRLARAFGVALARAGFTVVSGGALGIDAAAHEGALEAGGATVAVLGSGVLRPEPPRNRPLFARILASGGGLISELPPLQEPSAWMFPRRNRLIAALVQAVVVVRATAESGCRYTVEPAMEMGRLVFAVPAPELGARAAGCARFIADGAEPIRSPGELLEALGRPGPKAAELPPLEPEERQVLDAVAVAPASLASIAASAGLAAGVAAQAVAGLCAKGLVRPAGAGRFAPVDR